MKFLWLGWNDKYCITSRLYYFRKALSKVADVVTSGRGFTSQETDVLKLVNTHKPDAVIFRGGPSINWNLEKPSWQNINKVGVLKILNYSDPQGERMRRMRANWINTNHINMTLHVVKDVPYIPRDADRYSMDKFKGMVFPEHKPVYLPFAVDSEIFRDYEFDRVYDICLMGRVYWLYPLRKIMWETLLERSEITKDGYPNIHVHSSGVTVFHKVRVKKSWGWDDQSLKKNDILIHEDYAKAISRCKMMCFDGSLYHYPSQKYFECMATKTLAVAEKPCDAEDLHFIPDYNFVEVNKDNFMDKIRYYLENESERKRITNNAYETILRYHTLDIRIQQFIGYVKELLNNA